MKICFSKYQGTGNDFILIDNRDKSFPAENISLVEKLCDRRFGIGCDGLMLLENEEGFDFKMRYFNSDGKEGSMCGNGGRCIVAFAYKLNIIKDKAHFIAVDGEHFANISFEDEQLIVSLQMQHVSEIENGENFYYLNTGSPHYTKFIANHDNFDTFTEGKAIRYNKRFKEVGTNVNFISGDNNHIQVSTYERGVEDETYSCGTGVVASSISAKIQFKTESNHFYVKTLGGNLEVYFDYKKDDKFENIWLKGPATFVFNGKLEF
ncbi:diaminopimelate epimerase [Ancylomarina sp. 16SWW S1-10-2]|uniref:diaminopimelate epimerase n=1 Tax=Ancylomarina sp. 16SWW S1-10-2 TaxID=2499681 RepID=UPI0012AE41E0|nr:diaminopimelate epimerase [Ancylomarina sp. 16SWW S1-10-2]MRT93269.1 diaminopimelate epimerase [Ancylomarina sp. 16SWW S1-10-2]